MYVSDCIYKRCAQNPLLNWIYRSCISDFDMVALLTLLCFDRVTTTLQTIIKLKPVLNNKKKIAFEYV